VVNLDRKDIKVSFPLKDILAQVVYYLSCMMQDALVRMHVSVQTPRKSNLNQPVHVVIHLGPTPLKEQNQRKVIPKLAQIELAM